MTSRVLPACTRWPVVLVCAVLLSGCGSKTPPHYSPANITGNWELTVKPADGSAGIAVYLTSNAGRVSGVAFGPPATDLLCSPDGCCGSPIGLFDEALTGTVDANGNLKLGTAVAGNPVFAMTGVVSGPTLSNGSFTLAGTCITQGSVTGTEYPPLNGTYSGTLTSQTTGQSFTVSASINQSSGPNSNGYLSLGGTVNVSGNPCIASGGATPLSLNTTYVGSFFNASFAPSPGATLFLTGVLSPDGKTLAVNYGFTLADSSCNGDGGSGTLTLQ